MAKENEPTDLVNTVEKLQKEVKFLKDPRRRTDYDLDSIEVEIPLGMVGRSTQKVTVKHYFNAKVDDREDVFLILQGMIEDGKKNIQVEGNDGSKPPI